MLQFQCFLLSLFICFCVWHGLFVTSSSEHVDVAHDRDGGRGVDTEDLLSDERSAVMNCATSFPPSAALRWHRRPLHPFNKQKEEAGMINWLLGVNKGHPFSLSVCEPTMTGCMSHSLQWVKSRCSSASAHEHHCGEFWSCCFHTDVFIRVFLYWRCSFQQIKTTFTKLNCSHHWLLTYSRKMSTIQKSPLIYFKLKGQLRDLVISKIILSVQLLIYKPAAARQTV